MRHPAHAFALAIVLAGTLLWPLSSTASDAAVKVIAHPTRAGALTLADLRAIYLKQRLLWADGQPIIAINREAGSEARERFSAAVFGQNSRRLAEYWNQRYFEAGEFPPATLASDAAMVRFVAGNANAIGYVTLERIAGDVVVVLTLP
jgi:ABC-type phosphate transport system substrate-binding protein